MGYVTDWALAIEHSIVDDFLREAKKSHSIPDFLEGADKILKDGFGNLLFISDMKGFQEFVGDVQKIMDGIDEDGELWLMRSFGEANSDLEDFGCWHDNPFSIYTQRVWHVDEEGCQKLKKIEWPNAITAMRKAVEDGRKHK